MRDKYKIFNHTQWHKIPVIYNKHNNPNYQQWKYNQFINNIYNQYMIQRGDIYIFPIIMFDQNDKYSMQYIWKILLNNNDYIGIAFYYDQENNDIKICAIHLDEQCMINQYKLIETHYNMNNINHNNISLLTLPTITTTSTTQIMYHYNNNNNNNNHQLFTPTITQSVYYNFATYPIVFVHHSLWIKTSQYHRP